jgi:dihydrofolate reductase
MTATICAIAAMSQNLVIGKDNKLLWHIPDDFRHFKETTMGKPVIMGRKTYESIGKPLPGRTNIVITSKPDQVNGDVVTVTSLDDAISKAQQVATETMVDEIFIIGGGQIYEAAMPKTDRIYLTVIHQDFEGDTRFPKINPMEWSEEIIQTADEPVPYMIGVLNRK